jgi:hypothetical protein
LTNVDDEEGAYIWTASDDIVGQLRRLWDRGAVLAEVAGGPSVFPYRFRLRRPRTAELSDRYDAVRIWIRDLSAMPEIRIEWQSAGNRSVGRNDVPAQVWVDNLDSACRLLGTTQAIEQFRSIVTETANRQPALCDWLIGHPLEALDVAVWWPDLLAVVAWIRNHQPSDFYVRQIDLPRVNTKFVETNRVVLGSMLDAVLPTDAIDLSVTAASAFARRYRFRVPPATVTLRSLDPDRPVRLAASEPILVADRAITVTVDDFARLHGVRRVFVTENYINFLAFPHVTDAIILFGQGFDVGKLAQAPWLHDVPVHYWGDIDTYGFAILDHLRSLLPTVLSMLMDSETLIRHKEQWVVETQPTRRDLANLRGPEAALYDDLRDNRFGRGVRLEQELIDFAWVLQALSRL